MSGSVGDNTARASGVIASAGGGGAWTKISHQTASNDTEIDFTSFSADYQDFKLVGSGVRANTNAVNIFLRLSQAGSFITTNTYRFGSFGLDSDNNIKQHQGNPLSYIGISTPSGYISSANAEGGGFETTIYNVHHTVLYKNIITTFVNYTNNNRAAPSFSGAIFCDQAAVDGIRVFMSTGNISIGEFTLYGRKIT